MDRHEILAQAEAMYAQLVEVYPNDVRFLRKYAEILEQEQKLSQARLAWERLHALLLGGGRKDEARELESRFPYLKEQGQAMLPHDGGLLAYLDDSLAQRLIRRMHEIRLRENEVLFHKGDAADAMYVVLHGRLLVLDDAAKEKPIVLNILEKGNIVGEMALLCGGMRSADVVATSECRLLRLSKKDLLRLTQKAGGLDQKLMREAELRHRVTQISRNRLLARLPLADRRRLAEQATPCRVRAGERLCEGGALIQEVRLVTKGVADAVYTDHRGADHWLHDVQGGDLVGEQAILAEAQYPTDVLASTPLEFLALPLDVLRDMFMAHRGARLQLENLVSSKITKTMTILQRIKRIRRLD